MVHCIINASKRLYFATVFIPDSFIQSDMYDIVHIIMKVFVSERLVKLNTKLYIFFLKIEDGNPVLYVALKKHLYYDKRDNFITKKLSKISNIGVLK